MAPSLFMSSFLLLITCPWLASARLNTGIIELTSDNFDTFMNSHEKVMVDFVSGAENQTEQLLGGLKKIREFGSRVPLCRVNAASELDLAKRFVPSTCNDTSQRCHHGFPQLLWFVHGEVTRYHRRLSQADHIASFVLAMDRPLVTTIADELEIDTWNRLVLYRGAQGSEIYKSLERVASQHMDTLAIAHMQSTVETVTWIVDKQVVDIFAGDIGNDETVETWVRGHLVWSEDVPEEPMEDGTVVVVGKTFEQLVLRDDSDVFLMVYAPWCGFSRKALPIWGQLAQAAAELKGISIAKMDGTHNVISVLDFSWNTYPTIVYFRRGEKKQIVFDGERTLEAFIAFAKSHSSVPLDFKSSTPKGLVLLQNRASYVRFADL